MEDHDIIDSVQEFRPEEAVKLLLRQVGCHDNNRVLKVHGPALVVRQPAIVQQLQQQVEYIRMCLLDLIEQDNTVRFSPYRFRQLSAFFITNIPRRRSYQTGHRMLLHVLRHIDSNQVLFGIEQGFAKCFCQLRLTNTCRPQENKGTDWTVFIL